MSITVLLRKVIQDDNLEWPLRKTVDVTLTGRDNSSIKRTYGINREIPNVRTPTKANVIPLGMYAIISLHSPPPLQSTWYINLN